MILLLQTIDFLLMVFTYIIVIQAVLSWLVAFNVINMQSQFVRNLLEALHRMTEPFYRPIRKIMPDLGMLDLSPLVVLLILMFLRGTLIPYLIGMFANQGLG